MKNVIFHYGDMYLGLIVGSQRERERERERDILKVLIVNGMELTINDRKFG